MKSIEKYWNIKLFMFTDVYFVPIALSKNINNNQNNINKVTCLFSNYG